MLQALSFAIDSQGFRRKHEWRHLPNRLFVYFLVLIKKNSLSGFWQDATALKIFVICIHFLFTPPSPPPVCQHDTTLLFSKGAEMEADRERKCPLSAVL